MIVAPIPRDAVAQKLITVLEDIDTGFNIEVGMVQLDTGVKDSDLDARVAIDQTLALRLL